MIMCANDDDSLYSRHWNVEQTNKLPAKKVLWYEPSSECGKPMNADISWSASNTPEYCDKLGKFGRGVYGIREISKVRTTLLPPCHIHAHPSAFSYCTRFCSAFPSPRHFFRTRSLAEAPRHATRRAGIRSAICQCATAVPHSLQMACTITRALETFPSGQVR